jgi:hypothetical protein
MFQERFRGAAGAAKHRKFPALSASIQPYRSGSTHDCVGVFSYAKFTPGAETVMRVQCNMNFFSSSRKIFAPV